MGRLLLKPFAYRNAYTLRAFIAISAIVARQNVRCFELNGDRACASDELLSCPVLDEGQSVTDDPRHILLQLQKVSPPKVNLHDEALEISRAMPSTADEGLVSPKHGPEYVSEASHEKREGYEDVNLDDLLIGT